MAPWTQISTQLPVLTLYQMSRTSSFPVLALLRFLYEYLVSPLGSEYLGFPCPDENIVSKNDLKVDDWKGFVVFFFTGNKAALLQGLNLSSPLKCEQVNLNFVKPAVNFHGNRTYVKVRSCRMNLGVDIVFLYCCYWWIGRLFPISQSQQI